MAKKKLKEPVTISTVVEKDQHNALRYIALRERTSMASIIRKAVARLIFEKSEKYHIPVME